MIDDTTNLLPDEDVHDAHLKGTRSSLYHVFGIDCQHKRCNIALTSFNFLYVTGNCLVQNDLKTNQRRYLLGIGGGIGCFFLHEKKNRVFLGNNALVGHVGASICVYSLPDFVLTQRLFGGAEKGYKCLDLNSSGTKLASISSFDNSLIIWDIENGTLLLKTKAFGQDVRKVMFSPYDEGSLITCGSGHICFWALANTFTGLKLHGSIGKFGKVEQCDVNAFVIASDGKVVTGSETGHGLLWEAGIVKCRLVCSSSTACGGSQGELTSRALHEGNISFMTYQESGHQLMTAGVDGKIKFWCMQTIETAEVNSAVSMDFLIQPIRVLFLGDDHNIWNIAGPIKGESTVAVANYDGGLFLVDLTSEQVSKRVDGHGGTVVGLDVSPLEHICVTACSGGIIHCWDYIAKTLFSSTKTQSACSAIRWAPKEIDCTGRTIAVGHDTGVLRFMYIKSKDIILLLAVKPHTKKISCIRFTKCGTGVATASADGTVFVFRCSVILTTEDELILTPVGFVDCGGFLMNIKLRPDTSGFTYCNSAGEAAELDWGSFADLAPRVPATSFALNFSLAQCTKSTNNFLEVVEENAIIPLFLRASTGDGESNAIDAKKILVHDEAFSFAGFCSSWDKTMLLVASSDGTLGVLCIKQESSFPLADVQNDNGYSGADKQDSITPLANDEISNGNSAADEDESMTPLADDQNSNSNNAAERCTALEKTQGVNELIEEFFLTTSGHDCMSNIFIKEGTELSGCDSLALEEWLYNTQKDIHKLETERTKQAMQEILNKLRLDCLQLAEMNDNLPKAVRIPRQDLAVESEEVLMLKRWKEKDVLDAQNKCLLESEKMRHTLATMQRNFLGAINWEHFVLRSLNDRCQFIQSFTTGNIPKVVQDEVDTIAERKSDSGLMFPSREDGCNKDFPKSTTDDMQSTTRKSSPGNSYNTRKTRRLKRGKELLEKRSQMPDENSYDNKSTGKIKDVESNRGDYVVKTAPGYVATSSNPKSVELILEQLVLLHSSINLRKCSFNDRLLNLWQGRKRLISEIRSAKESQPIHSSLGSMCTNMRQTFLIQSSNEEQEEQESTFLKTNPTVHFQDNANVNLLGDPLFSCVQKNDTLVNLEGKTQTILENLQTIVDFFDCSFLALRQERSKLGFALKQSELRLTELAQEIEPLIKFKENDSELLLHISLCSQNKSNLSKMIEGCHIQIESTQAELQALLAKDAELLTEMIAMVPENNIYHYHLQKIFSRKQSSNLDENKRMGYAMDAKDEDNDEDLLTDERDDSCPDGCDLELYAQVLILRDSRRLIEQELLQFQQKLRSIKQTIDHHQKCEQELSRELELANENLRIFQLKKQVAVNEILVIRALKTSQIYLWRASVRTSDVFDVPNQIKSSTCLEESVLFSNDRLVSLWQRILQLKEEISRDKDEFKDLQKEMVRLENSKLSKEDFIQKQKMKIEELELLKFGQLVDINELDRMTHSTIDDDLRVKEEEKIKANDKVSLAASDHLRLLKEKFLNSTNQNTYILNQLADLTEKQLCSGKGLENAESDQIECSQNPCIDERELIDLRNQAKTQHLHIKALQTEISNLKQKPGRIHFPFNDKSLSIY